MKKKDIDDFINENLQSEGTNLNHNGYQFTATKNFDIFAHGAQVDETSFKVTWSASLEVHNDGIYGANMYVVSIIGNQVLNGQIIPVDFSQWELDERKVKNPDISMLQVFLETLDLDFEHKRAIAAFSI